MKLLLLLLVALPQDPVNTPTDPAAVHEQFQGIAAEVEVLPLNELRQRIVGGEYVPVPRGQLQDVLDSAESPLIPNAASTRPQIREARYSATLNGTLCRSATTADKSRHSREGGNPSLKRQIGQRPAPARQR